MKDRIYIFSYGENITWTSCHKEREKMLENKEYCYKGYIDPDTKASGGPDLTAFSDKLD